ncbi:MAG: hypothetical protein R3B47_03915 [Bacteroidia bacterium]
MDAGIYYIDDNTPTWTVHGQSPAVEVNDLKVHLGSHQLVASTGPWCLGYQSGGEKRFSPGHQNRFDPAPTLDAPTHVDSVHARAVVQDPNGTIS